MAQIDQSNFNENDLVELKVPVNLPYYNSNKNYERVDGEIEFGGIHYNYVKRKISNDTVYLMCLPNHEKTQLYKDKNSYASQANELPNSEKDNNSSVKKKGFSNEYISHFIQYSIIGMVTPIHQFPDINPSQPAQGFCCMQAQPPEQLG